MDHDKMDIISPNIMKKVQQKQDVNEETVFALWEWIAKHMNECEEFSDFSDCMHLMQFLDSMWAYQNFETVSVEQTFLRGGIWGALHTLETFYQSRNDKRGCQQLVHKYRDDTSFLFLEAIHAKPGIKNITLSGVCGVTTARISQMTKTAEQEGLITSQRNGREKYYYMKSMGNAVYKTLKRERSPKQNYDVNYKSLIFDNQTIEPFTKAELIKQLESNYEILAITFREKSRIDFDHRKDNYICEEKTNLLSISNNTWELPKAINLTRQPLYTK